MGRNISDEEMFTNISDLLNKHVIVAPPAPPPPVAAPSAPAPSPAPSPSPSPAPAPEPEPAPEPAPQGLSLADEIREFSYDIDAVKGSDGKVDADPEVVASLKDRYESLRRRVPEQFRPVPLSERGSQSATPQRRVTQSATPQRAPTMPTKESTIAAVDNVLADIRRDGEVISQELGFAKDDGDLDYKNTDYDRQFNQAFETIFPNGEHLFHKDMKTERGSNIPVPSDLDVPGALTALLSPVTMVGSVVTNFVVPGLPDVPFLYVEQGSSDQRERAKSRIDTVLRFDGANQERDPGSRLTKGQKKVLTALDYTSVFSGYSQRIADRKDLTLQGLEQDLSRGLAVDSEEVNRLQREYVIAAMEQQTHSALAPVVASKLILDPADTRSYFYGAEAEMTGNRNDLAMSPEEVSQRGFREHRRSGFGLGAVNRLVSENYIGQQEYDRVLESELNRQSQPKVGVRRVFSDVLRAYAMDEETSPSASVILLDLERFMESQPEFYQAGTPVKDQFGEIVDSHFATGQPTFTNENDRAVRQEMGEEFRAKFGTMSVKDQEDVLEGLAQAQRAGQMLARKLRNEVVPLETIFRLQDYSRAAYENRPVVNQLNQLYANALEWDSATMGLISEVVVEENKRTKRRAFETLGID